MTTNFDELSGTAPNTFEPAQFWFDVGYLEKVDLDEGIETRFISQGNGIGLDKLDDLTIGRSNELCRIIQAARTELMAQIMDVAKILDPGEHRIIGNAGRLEIHLRRLNAEQPAVKAEEQTFAERQAMVG